MSVTSQTIIDAHGNPEDSWGFARRLEQTQDRESLSFRHSVLFNKGRYFETSIYDQRLLKQVSELSGIEPQYDTMIVAEWKHLEDFIIAMNMCDYEVKISVDWV